MSERKFKKGDRVIGIGTFDDKRIDCLYGTVIGEKSSRGNYPIEFDEYINGHSCISSGRCVPCEPGHGWWVPPSQLKLANKDWKVVIVPEGDKTLGRLYEDGKVTKSVETTKHPDDEYSIEAACDVIMERLFEPTYYNGKVVCLSDYSASFTKGKVYTVTDGKIKADDSNTLPINYDTRFKDFEDLEEYFRSSDERKGTFTTHWCYKGLKFIEVVE
jgi:hypothetical protein